MVVCGKKRLHLATFGDATNSLALLYKYAYLVSGNSIILNAIISLYDIKPLAARYLVGPVFDRSSLLDILYVHRNSRFEGPFYCASNPSDIFFGLLGISRGEDRIMDVDYTKPIEDIFTALPEICMEGSLKEAFRDRASVWNSATHGMR